MIQCLTVFRRMHFANMGICDQLAGSAWRAHLERIRPGDAIENQTNDVLNDMRCRYYLCVCVEI